MKEQAVLLPIGFLTLQIKQCDVAWAKCGVHEVPLVCAPANPHITEVPLPGWIWRDIASTEPVTITWPGGKFILQRYEVAKRLSELAVHPAASLEAAPLVGALEHVHYGGLPGSWDPVKQGVDQWLRDAAYQTGLQDLQPYPFVSISQPAGRSAEQAFGAALRSDHNNFSCITPTDLDRAFALALPLAKTPEDQEALLLAVTPEFCRVDHMVGLCEMLQAHGLAGLASMVNAPWARAQILAFRLIEHDVDGSDAIAKEIINSPWDWASTPTLAWILRSAVNPQQKSIPPALCRRLIDTVMRFAEARAPLACVELIDSSITALRLGWMSFPDDLREAVLWRSLRAFGTSPTFWSGVSRLLDEVPGMPPQLHAGLQAFNMLADSTVTTNTIQREALATAGIRQLWKLGVADIDRIALEAIDLPPSTTAPSLSQLLTERFDSPAILLRHAMSPHSPPPYPYHEQALCQALRFATDNVPSSPWVDPIRCAMQKANDIRRAAHSHNVNLELHLKELIGSLSQLADKDSRHVGLGIGLALLADLIELGNPIAVKTANSLCAALMTMTCNIPPDTRADVLKIPLMRSALARLSAVASTTLPDILRLLKKFPALPGKAVSHTRLRPQGLQLGSALMDTLVVVVSCHANLNTRVAALRRGWLRDLKRWDIPYVVVVGGETTHLSDDILEVSAPDTYEALPLKILTMLEWVEHKTGFEHILKIDDDCHVDVETWFGDGLWRLSEWYGRALDKSGPLSERTWHQKRATSAAGRFGLETLPHVGIYTDGSTGYSLSRVALNALSAQSNSLEGRRLIAGAFSEDKLLGALLTRAGLAIDNTAYYSLILRKQHQDGTAVPQWSEGVMPKASLRHTKVVHFDDIVPTDKIVESYAENVFEPARIWPTNRHPRIGHNTSSMISLSPPKRLNHVINAQVVVVSVIRNEAVLLPHFLDHYRGLGVGGFLFIDNMSEDSSQELLRSEPDVALFSCGSDFNSADQGTDWKVALLSHFRQGRWSLVADADEFLLLPQGTSLPEHVARLDPDYNAQQVLMRDMYPHGPFSKADFSVRSPFEAAPGFDTMPFKKESISRGPFSNSETFTSALRHRLMPNMRVDAFVAQKVALLRYAPWMRLSTSLHYAAEVKTAPDALVFAHFKYSAGFAAKATIEAGRGQYWNNAEEYRAYCASGFSVTDFET